MHRVVVFKTPALTIPDRSSAASQLSQSRSLSIKIRTKSEAQQLNWFLPFSAQEVSLDHVLTEKPAQKGHECRTLGEVVRARAAKLTARMRLPRTI